MGIFDKQNMYSEDQAITASAVSTNVIDHTIAGIGEGEPIEVIVKVTAAFATLTSLVVTLQTDSDEAFGTAQNVLATAAIPAASLVAGYEFRISTMPSNMLRYTRLSYTVAGSDATAGTIWAGLAVDRSTV